MMKKDVVRLLKDYFEINDYLVITAYSESDAIEKASQNPEIILLDVNVPDGDGLTVCKKIRDHVSCPIVFLTAWIENSDKISGFPSGGDDYIIKPFFIDELGARVAAHIRRDHRIKAHANVQFFGGMTINYTTKTILAEGTVIEYAKKSFRI